MMEGGSEMYHSYNDNEMLINERNDSIEIKEED